MIGTINQKYRRLKIRFLTWDWRSKCAFQCWLHHKRIFRFYLSYILVQDVWFLKIFPPRDFIWLHGLFQNLTSMCIWNFLLFFFITTFYWSSYSTFMIIQKQFSLSLLAIKSVTSVLADMNVGNFVLSNNCWYSKERSPVWGAIYFVEFVLKWTLFNFLH